MAQYLLASKHVEIAYTLQIQYEIDFWKINFIFHNQILTLNLLEIILYALLKLALSSITSTNFKTKYSSVNYLQAFKVPTHLFPMDAKSFSPQ